MNGWLTGLMARVALVISLAAGAAWLIGHETPRGTVRGTLVAAESGALLADTRVSLAEEKGDIRYTTRTNRDGRFAFPSVAAGTYRLVAQTEAHEAPKLLVSVAEGRTTEAVYELKPVDPFLRVFERQRVFTTREEPALRVHGFAPSRTMGVRLYRVRDDLLLDAWEGNIQRALNVTGPLQQANLDGLPGLVPARRFDLSITRRDAEGVFREEVRLGRLTPGMYVAAFDAAGLRALTAVTITDLAVVLKAAPGQAVAFAADIVSGEPVPGARITILKNGGEISSGATGLDGTYAAPLPRQPGEQQVSVIARSGPSVAIARAWLYSEDAENPLRVYTYTDRPVYRPGHRVFARSLMRVLRKGRYFLPGNRAATIRVSDPNDETIYTTQERATDLGSLATEFDLPREALPGIYTIRVFPEGGGEHEASFTVAEYRKPEYNVTVTPGKDRFTRGETVTATIGARYYFGAPVAKARVRYYITRAPQWYFEGAAEWDEDTAEDAISDDGFAEGEFIGEGEGVTNDAGDLAIRVPLEPENRSASGPGDEDAHDWRYTVHATVSDVSERSEDGQGSVLVTQGDFRVDVEPLQYLARPNQPVDVRVRVTDYEGRPVSGVSGELTFARRVWSGNKVRARESSDQGFTTGADGMAIARVTATRDGDWRVEAAAKDAGGNAVHASGYLWVMSSSQADFDYPYQDLQVRADRRLYRAGDVAEIVVNTRHAPQTALLTLESGAVLERRLVRLAGKSTVLKVTVTEAMMPAARASICLIREKNFLSDDAVLGVSREQKALKVSIAADKETYQPGEEATWTVRTLNPDGKPVAAEFSLGVVDEAVYAIRRDDTPNIVSWFYPRRVDEVRTVFSFPDVYLSGDDKAGGQIETRRFFPDTAFWRPTALTGADGAASFRMKMPDNLTTWRATVRASTAETRVGQATHKVICSKPFLVRLVAPRFATQGDEMDIAGVVHNLTGGRVEATAGLETGILSILDRPRTAAALDNGATRRFAWRTRADSIGDTELRAFARAGTWGDAMALSIPVIPRGRKETDAVSGDTSGAITHRFEVRQDAVAGTQKLEVRIAPSLLGAMFGSLDYLAVYPYGCVEQTMSAFLPDIVIHEIERRKAPNLTRDRRLTDMVRAGLYKIQALQNADGSWGWWRYDGMDPWMTAYVNYGLLRARMAGFTVPQNVFEPAFPHVERIATGKVAADVDTRAFAAYVLALSGNADAAVNAARAIRDRPAAREKLTDYGRCYLALAFARGGHPETGRVILRPVLARVVNRKFVPIRLDPKRPGVWRSDAEYGAALLYAGCELTPNEPRLGELARWLVNERRGNHWSATRDTAASLYAFARYVELTGELAPDFTVNVFVNGRRVGGRRFGSDSVTRPEAVFTVDAAALPPGPVEVRVEVSGRGRAYYTASLSQVASMDLATPVRGGTGLAIERAYRAYAPGRKEPRVGRAQDRFEAGDVVEITLTLRSSASFEYLMVEDPLPAGLEVSDRGPVNPWEWMNWWAEQIVRDEMVAFAVRKADPGVRRITYRAVAQTPGRFTALPTRVYDMYNPATRAEGAADTISVRGR